MWYGIDFGTSNSLLSFVGDSGEPRLINLENDGPVLRSLIFTPDQGEYYFGADAIDQYQELGGEGRFFRSLKKFLPEPGFKGTEVFGKRMKIEELIAVFLREMKNRSDQEVGKNITNVVLGRPALYSLDPDKDRLAQERMQRAAQLAGFKEIKFCPEPVAAGLSVGSDFRDGLVLVCDFGGGTSDFTLLEMDGSVFSEKNVRGLSGVFVAGDAIDGRIMRNFVSSHFGKDIKYRVPMGDNELGFPRRLLGKLCNPAHIVFLKERDTWEFLKELEQWVLTGDDQKYISQLFCLVEEDLGYPIYSSIEKSKIELGSCDKSLFEFVHSDIDIQMPLLRQDFESSVDNELEEIFAALEKVFEQSGYGPKDIDRVRITGGTGQMPLIQKYLIERFGREKIEMSEAFQSVAQGLGKYAQGL